MNVLTSFWMTFIFLKILSFKHIIAVGVGKGGIGFVMGYEMVKGWLTFSDLV